jgi:uncharacterized surface protein with fasciclin (FAS1) repeats
MFKQKSLRMKNLIRTSLIILVALVAFSCSNDDDNNVEMNTEATIAGFVAENPQYTSLLAALERADLVSTLDGTSQFTVFAPNNAAFTAFLNANGFASLNDVPVDLLRNVLLNHVVAGTVESSQLSTGYVNTLATYGASDNNLSLYVNTASGVELNGISGVTDADISASNGVIHAVDAVIGLPTVVTFATADSTFENLVAALTRADQPDFVSILNTPLGTDPAPFTVFAPTNDAFADLLTELGATDLSDIDAATLTATLNTHVIAGANVRAEDLVDGVVTTLGGDINIDAGNAVITDANGRMSNIVVVNVQASNGVVHVIDKVILPQL